MSMRRMAVLLLGSPVVKAYMDREKDRAVSAHRRGRFDHYKGLKARQEAARGGS